MMECEFGCGHPAKHQLKSGKLCCSQKHNSCPAVRQRISATKQGRISSPSCMDAVELVCPSCKEKFTRRREYIERRQRADKTLTCTSCSNRKNAQIKWKQMDDVARQKNIEALVKGGEVFRKQLTPEERSARSAHAGAANTSLSVHRQWESIRNTPGKLEAIKLQRGRTSKAIWDNMTPEQRDARIKKMLGSRSRSAAGDRFLQTLRDKGLTIEAEQAISGFVVDGLIRASKIILEFYGDFWHCRPNRHNDPQQFCSWLGRTVEQQWARDRKRLGVFYNLGYKVIIVWESDWNADQEIQIARILQISNPVS